jgi:hypothetical protein
MQVQIKNRGKVSYKVWDIIDNDRASWPIYDTLRVYSGGAPFESQPGYRLFCPSSFVAFRRPSRQLPGFYHD